MGQRWNESLPLAVRTNRRGRLWWEATRDALVAAPREHLAILRDDIRYGARMWAKTPGFTAVALLVIALGIGATTTVFSLVNAVLLRSLPYGEADKLVYMWRPTKKLPQLPLELSPVPADVIAWQTRNTSFTDITAFEQTLVLLTGGQPIRVNACKVFGNFFQTLQVHPQLGRMIDGQGPEQVAVLSDALWHARFGGASDVLEKNIEINQKRYRVIGVMPKGFAYPHANDFPGDLYNTRGETELWIPMALSAKERTDPDSGADTSAAIGRLRPGVSLERAQSEMSAIQKSLIRGKDEYGLASLLVPFVETAVGPVRQLLNLLMGAVFVVLLIVTSNVANLLLGRAEGRVHEMGVRTALGAERARLFRQMLTESLMLAIGGGALGVAISAATIRAIAELNPGDIPRLQETSLDLHALLFAIGLSTITGVLFGLLPARISSTLRLSQLLRQGGRGIAGGTHTRSALIVMEVALSVVLLASAGLILRSYLEVQRTDKGYAPSTLTMNVAMDTTVPPERAAAQLRTLMTTARRLPGVEAVGSTNALPLSHAENIYTFEVEGYQNKQHQIVDFRMTAGDYFRAMQIRLIAGRYLVDGDVRRDGQNTRDGILVGEALVVSESFAKTYFAGRDAIGGWVKFGDTRSRIVGVVADVRHTDLEQVPKPTVYWQNRFPGTLVVRTTAAPEALIPSLRKTLREIDPNVALEDIKTMRAYIDEFSSRRRFQTVLLTSFAGVALILALVGLYGVLAHSVRERTAEIGVRIALGASRGDVLEMVVRQGLRLTLTGLVLGLAAAWGATRWLGSMLFGVEATDPVTFIGVPVFLLCVATLACVIPVWKAARIDPVEALRAQ